MNLMALKLMTLVIFLITLSLLQSCANFRE